MGTAIQRLVSIARRMQAEDIRLMDEYLAHSPFHPGYWCRVRIDGAIAASAKLASGRLLDVGCGTKPYRHLFEPHTTTYFGLEYSAESGYRGNLADVCGDAAALPIADATIDTILCTEVLEHLPDPEQAIAEFERVLRPGGTVITTAPFFYPIHDPLDFFRYSPDGLSEMMKRNGLTVVKVEPLSGTAVTLALMFNLYWYEIVFMWSKWLYPIGLMLRPLLWLCCLVVNLAGGLLEKIVPSNHMSFNHLTIASKE